ncbi:MAG: hypothetical protein WCE63_16460 [Acidobacteriaceae bacterium]
MRLDWYGLAPASEAVPAVRSALSSALRLQPDSVAGLCDLAITQAGLDWDWNAAANTFNRAIAAYAHPVSRIHQGVFWETPLARQVGGDVLLEDLFPETRFNSWTVAETHVLDQRIIPNGRRDDYEHNA